MSAIAHVNVNAIHMIVVLIHQLNPKVVTLQLFFPGSVNKDQNPCTASRFT